MLNSRREERGVESGVEVVVGAAPEAETRWQAVEISAGMVNGSLPTARYVPDLFLLGSLTVLFTHFRKCP